MSLLTNRRRGMGAKEGGLIRIVSVTDGIYYSRTSTSNFAPKAYDGEDWCGIIIELAEEVNTQSITFAWGGTTSTSIRLMSYDEDGVYQTFAVYRPDSSDGYKTTTGEFNIKTIYFTVRKEGKNLATLIDDTNNTVWFDGSSFNWAKYGIE